MVKVLKHSIRQVIHISSEPGNMHTMKCFVSTLKLGEAPFMITAFVGVLAIRVLAQGLRVRPSCAASALVASDRAPCNWAQVLEASLSLLSFPLEFQ